MYLLIYQFECDTDREDAKEDPSRCEISKEKEDVEKKKKEEEEPKKGKEAIKEEPKEERGEKAVKEESMGENKEKVVKDEESKGEEKVKDEESKGEKKEDDIKQPPPLSPSPKQQEEKDESTRKDENERQGQNRNKKWHQSILVDVLGESDEVHLTGLEFHLGITPEAPSTSCANCYSNSMSNFLYRMKSRTSKLTGKKTMMLANRRVVDRDRLIEARFLSKIYNIGNVDSYQWRADLEREAHRIYMDWISQEGVEWSDKVNCQQFALKIYEAFAGGKKIDSTAAPPPQQILEPAKDHFEGAQPLMGESTPDHSSSSSLQPQIQAVDKPVEIFH